MKNFVNAMDQTSPAFRYLHEKSSLDSAKQRVKREFCESLDSRALQRWPVQQLTCSTCLHEMRQARLVSTSFLENVKAENYKGLVEDLLMQYQKLGCNMSLKIRFLHSHLDFFSDNTSVVSDEHGERFRKISQLWNKDYTMKNGPLQYVADYCWTLQRCSQTAV